LTVGKKFLNSNISSTYLHNGELLPTDGGDRLAGLGHPSKFQRGLGFVTAVMSLNGSQQNFARCLAVCWAGIHFRGFLPPNRILSGVKFTLRPSLVFSCFGSVTARHWSRGRQPNFSAWYKEWNYGTFASYHFQQRAPPIFGRAAITLGIGPHSSWT